MKKVLFIIHSLTSGGAEKVLIDIFNEFDYSEYSVSLLLLKKEGRYIERLPSQINLEYLHSQTIFSRIINKILRIIGLYELITTFKIRNKVKDNYDSIISFCNGDSLKYHTKILKFSENNVTWVHCDMLERSISDSVDIEREEEFYKKMNKIIFVSNDAKKKFNLLYNDRVNICQKVIYNLIPVDQIKKMSESMKISKNSKFTICTVGRFYKEKAYDRLIRVAALLKQRNYDFEIWIIAEGILFNEIKLLTQKLDVEDRIIFFGFRENPYPYIKNADIFISTSKTEAMPLVVCEALCLGKPVIATKTTGPIELLSGDYGILTEHDDCSIFSAIEALILNTDSLPYYQNRAKIKSQIFDSKSTMALIYDIL